MKKILTLSAVALIASSAFADPFSWVQWNAPSGNVVTGSIATSNGPVGVTLTGNFDSILTNYPSWTPASSFADGVIIDNAPDNTSLVKVIGPTAFTLTFDSVVENLAFSVWSVGQNNQAITYTFDQDLTFVAGGPGTEFGGQSITTTTNTLTGIEGNGTVLFANPMTSMIFSTDPSENYHGFNIGLQTAQAVPEPFTMVGIGIAALALRKRKKN
jgi:hypothetical protein